MNGESIVPHRWVALAGLVAAWLGLVVCARGSAPDDGSPARGPRPMQLLRTATPPFDPGQSAGLFVGVRTFVLDETLEEVPYAVDDAIDLAHRFSLGASPPLIPAERIVLALSGEPQKPESVLRLEELFEAGAQSVPALKEDLVDALEDQAKRAGEGGLLVVTFATHGVRHRGRDYLLTGSTRDRHLADTSLGVAKVSDLAAASPSFRRLLLLDACRERRRPGARSSSQEVAADLAKALAAEGQAILSARPESRLYDDDARRQGVFTAAVLDGLDCRADENRDRRVTVGEMASFVNDQVAEWERRWSKSSLRSDRLGIAKDIDGDFDRFALVQCP